VRDLANWHLAFNIGCACLGKAKTAEQSDLADVEALWLAEGGE